MQVSSYFCLARKARSVFYALQTFKIRTGIGARDVYVVPKTSLWCFALICQLDWTGLGPQVITDIFGQKVLFPDPACHSLAGVAC